MRLKFSFKISFLNFKIGRKLFNLINQIKILIFLKFD